MSPMVMNLAAGLQDLVDEVRAKVRRGFPWWLRPFLQRGVVGITVGRRVYLADTLSAADFARYLRHELVHVRQFQELGMFGFLWRYLSEYVRLRRSGLPSPAAYAAISLEREATAAEDGMTV